MAKDVFLIVNPQAGGGRTRKIFPLIKDFLKENDIPFDFDLTHKPGEGVIMAQKAAGKNYKILAVVGGDGTINEVVNGLRQDQEAVMAVIPTGRGNDLAKHLGIINIKESISLLGRGRQGTIDLGLVNDRVFANTLGIGFDAEVARKMAAKKKAPLGGFISYMTSILQSFVSYKFPHITVEYDGEQLKEQALMITIGNGQYCGGGFRVVPQAHIDDGWLDFCVVRKAFKPYLLWHMPKVLKGSHGGLDIVKFRRAKDIVVRSTTELSAHLDGEVISDWRFEVGLLPKKQKILVN